MQDEHQSLRVEGSCCNRLRDDETAAWLETQQHLQLWMQNKAEDLWLDRFDVRQLLSDASQFKHVPPFCTNSLLARFSFARDMGLSEAASVGEAAAGGGPRPCLPRGRALSCADFALPNVQAQGSCLGDR